MTVKKTMPKWLKWTLLALAVLALLALYLWLKETGRLGIFNSPEEFRAWLSQFGAWAPIIFLLLQVVQVVVAFIPGEVTSVAGGIMFGFWWGMALSIVGITIGSLIAFSVAKKLGRPAVEKLAGGASLDKYLDIVKRHGVWLLFMMFLLPFFPKDALSYVAGLTGIAFPVFLMVSLIGRLPGQVMSTLVGAGMVTVPVWGWVLIGLGAVGLLVLSFKYSEKIGEWIVGRVGRKKAQPE